MGILYMVPNLLGDTKIGDVVPTKVIEIIKALKAFASENPRNTMKYLKKIDKTINLDEITFFELNEHSGNKEVQECANYLQTHDMGIISEAGCPGIADPGSTLVARAHQLNIKVVPLVGPSSILMALIASGSCGQRFSFNGYLPAKTEFRSKAIKAYERQSASEDRTEIFIETPYRNLKMFSELLQVLLPSTKLTIACNISCDDEYIITKTISDWKTNDVPNIAKRPAIFIIEAQHR